jgi:hypothetical protein
LLNVHYGLETVEETTVTAIGWGLIAEAYANYGDLGVLAAAICFGLLCGVFTRWSTGRSAVSLPTLAAIVTLASLLNIEVDATALVTALFQSLAAVFIFFGVFRFISGENPPRQQTALAALSHRRMGAG